jgi:heat induced stress protein YflT
MHERQSPSALRTGDYGTTRETVRSFTSYQEAERAVEYLVRQDFPIDRVAVIGRDLRGGGANHRSGRIRASGPARRLWRRGDRVLDRIGGRLVRLDLTADSEAAEIALEISRRAVRREQAANLPSASQSAWCAPARPCYERRSSGEAGRCHRGPHQVFISARLAAKPRTVRSLGLIGLASLLPGHNAWCAVTSGQLCRACQTCRH